MDAPIQRLYILLEKYPCTVSHVSSIKFNKGPTKGFICVVVSFMNFGLWVADVLNGREKREKGDYCHF